MNNFINQYLDARKEKSLILEVYCLQFNYYIDMKILKK